MVGRALAPRAGARPARRAPRCSRCAAWRRATTARCPRCAASRSRRAPGRSWGSRASRETASASWSSAWPACASPGRADPIAGRALPGRSAREHFAAGLAHIPSDRLRRALVLEMTLAENLALGVETARPDRSVARPAPAGARGRSAASGVRRAAPGSADARAPALGRQSAEGGGGPRAVARRPRCCWPRTPRAGSTWAPSTSFTAACWRSAIAATPCC